MKKFDDDDVVVAVYSCSCEKNVIVRYSNSC